MNTNSSKKASRKPSTPKNPFAAFQSLSAVSTQPENPYVELEAETLLAYYTEPGKFHTEVADRQSRMWTYASLSANTRKGQQTFLFNVSQLNSILSCLKGESEWPSGVTLSATAVKIDISQRDVINGNQVILRPFVGMGVNSPVEV